MYSSIFYSTWESLAFRSEPISSTMWFAFQTLLACCSELNSAHLHLSLNCILRLRQTCSFLKHSFHLQCNMVSISSGFTNGLTTCVKPSSVQFNCCLKDRTSTDALLPNRLGSAHYETQDEFGTDASSLHTPTPPPYSHLPLLSNCGSHLVSSWCYCGSTWSCHSRQVALWANHI